jgi:hypothetical protein
MCFSPIASFVTAGLTGTIGIISLSRTTERREWPLASVPLFFAAQQSIEGLIWLDLRAGSLNTFLPLLFLLFAEVLWPIFAPAAILLVEPKPIRRRLVLLCFFIGLGVGVYLLWWILTHSHSAAIVDDHIVYYTQEPHSDMLAVAYLGATGLPGLLSSRRLILILGSIVFIGSIAAYIFYWEAFVSVWCFFAAAASVVILAHFEVSRLPRLDDPGRDGLFRRITRALAD